MKYTHEDVMNLLKTVPGVTDHLNKPSVINAKREVDDEEPLSKEMDQDEAMDYLDGLMVESQKEKPEK